MPRVVMVTTSFPNGGGGAEAAGTFVADFARLMAERVDVSVLAPGSDTCTENAQGVSVRRFASPEKPLSNLLSANPLDWWRIWSTLRSGERVLESMVAEARVDHILALWALPSGHWARQVGRRHGIPYSTWALGSDIWSLGRIPLVRSYLARVLRDASTRYADGLILQQDVEALCGLPCGFLPSSRVLPVVSRKAPDGPGLRLSFLGRWHPNKGIDLLLEALELLTDEDWARIRRVNVFGGGPLGGLVRRKCAGLMAAGRPVVCGGYLDGHGAAELLAETDYLLLPSRIESIPVIFSDAMQAGCPIVATPVGDLPRLFREFHVGCLTADLTPRAIAETIHTVLALPAGEYGAGINRAIQTFDVGASVSGFLSGSGW